MNTDTGDIRRFKTLEEAIAAGYTAPLSDFMATQMQSLGPEDRLRLLKAQHATDASRGVDTTTRAFRRRMAKQAGA